MKISPALHRSIFALALGMVWLCFAARSSGSVTFYTDNFQSYPIQNPAPSPLTNGPAGGQWYFLNPIPANGITPSEHEIYQATTTGSGVNSTCWISDTNNAGLSNSIVVTMLPQNTNVATFTLNWLAATDTSTTNRDCTFSYSVTSSTGALGFLSGSNLDGSQILTGLNGYAIAKAGTFGKGPSRQFQLVFTATNLTLGSTVNFSFTRITNALVAGAFIVLDDVSLAVDAIGTNCTLTYLAGTNGTISGTSPQSVSYGASGTAVTAVPNSGYSFVNWSDGRTDNPRLDVNVTNNLTVTANFLTLVLFWDGGTTNITVNGDGISQGGSGVWDNTTSNWDAGAGLAHVAWNSNSTAVFGGIGGVVTLGTAITNSGLVMTATNDVTIAGAYGFVVNGAINLAGTNNFTIGNADGGTVNLSGATLTGSSLFTWNKTNDNYASPLGALNVGAFNSSNSMDFTGTLQLRGSTPSTAPGSMEGATGRFWMNSSLGSQMAGTAFALDTGASSSNGQDFIIGDWDANSGNRSLTLSSLTGYGTIRTDAGGTGTRNLTVVQTNNTTFNGMILSHYSSPYNRSIAFTKDGAGSLTLAGIMGSQTTNSSGGNDSGSTPLSVTVLNGTLVLAATNTLTGPTTVNGGTLVVTGIHPATSPITVAAGGTLVGTGVINSAVTNSGTLTPGTNGIGTLTVNNTLTLNAGSATTLAINRAAGTASFGNVQGITAATFGGTLTVTNMVGTFQNGDSFTLFSAGSYAGNFTATTLPVLNTGLTWNWNPAAGTLSVVVSSNLSPVASTVYAWFAGDSGLALGADNYSVTTWTNLGFAATNSTYTQAGRNLVNLTGTPQKLYLQLTNGAAAGAVAFGGSDGIWATKGTFGMLTNNYTIIACALVSNAVPEGFLFDGTSTTPGYTRALVWSNYWQVSVNSGTGTITAPAAINVWQIQSFVIGTNSGSPLFQHFINGVQVGSVAIGSPDYLSGLMIGANVSQADGIQADVAEFLVFNSALDNATRASVESYLSNKWTGVTVSTNAPPSPPPYVYTPVFISGQGYPEYRIPAMVTATNGTVIAAADGRQGNGDIPNPVDCVCKRSFDNGYTWGPLQVIADYGSNQNSNDVDTYPAYGITNPIPRTSAGNSSLLLDSTNGRVWLIYDNGAPTTNQFNSETRAIKLELRYSDDNGATWSPRVDVEALNPGLRPPLSYAPEIDTGPGNGIQLSSGTNAGRLIFPIYIYSGPNYSSRLIYSDDHGATWQMGGTAGLGGDENQDVETPNGGLLASMRDGAFSWSGVRTFSRSTDGGITWGALFTNTVPVIPDPTCQSSILRLTTTNDSNASRIVFANCDSSSSRVAMTLRLSYDEGQTWPVSNLVYSGVSGYSALTKLANGEVGLLNEVNNYARIDFVSRSVNVISGGTDTNLLGAASFLNMNVLPASGGNLPTLNFSTQSNNTYTIQCCTNLATGGWQPFMNISAQPTNSMVQLPLNPTNPAQFFRLVTPQLP